MTVAQLIALLQKHPSDMLVILNGHEMGYEDARNPEPREIAVNYNQKKARKNGEEECPWWKGVHEDASHAREPELKRLRCKIATALLIH